MVFQLHLTFFPENENNHTFMATPSTHSWQEKDMNTYIHAHTHTRVKLIMKLFLPIPKLLLLEFVLTTRVKIYMQLWILNGKLGHYCCLSFSFLLSLVFQTQSVATCRHWKKGIVMLQKKLKPFLIADIIICKLVCAVWKNISKTAITEGSTW